MEKKGIDVSVHQGLIDWAAVKASGVEFAIIRAGTSLYEGGVTEDKNFRQNMAGAAKVGLPVGVYVYSYDHTVEAARKTAQALAQLIAPYELTYPVAYDLEYENFTATAGKKLNTDIAAAFLEEMQKQGYYVMLYSSTSFFLQFLEMERLKAYDIWVADYRGYVGYTGPYGIWQHAGDSGRCPGVTGPCDLNIGYKDYPAIIRGAGLNRLGKPEAKPDPKPQPKPEKEIAIEALLERCRGEGYTRITLDGKSYITL